MKGVLFRQRLVASSLVSLHTSSTFLLTITLLLLNVPKKAQATNLTEWERGRAGAHENHRQGKIDRKTLPPSPHPPI
ncbi:MAG TPA: hypothetical protein V6D28_27635, partial [Leptolyngbyaceae cyanobacterium]